MSDSESSKDSDCGRRFKTESVRNISAESTRRHERSNNTNPQQRRGRSSEADYYDRRKSTKRRSKSQERSSSHRHKRKHKRHSSSRSQSHSSGRKSTESYGDHRDSRKRSKSKEHSESYNDSLSNDSFEVSKSQESNETSGPNLSNRYDTSKKRESEYPDNTYGPSLPKKKDDNVLPTKPNIPKKFELNEERHDSYGPAMPIKKDEINLKPPCAMKDQSCYGPSLPNIKNNKLKKEIVPSNFEKEFEMSKPNALTIASEDKSKDECYGPSLPKCVATNTNVDDKSKTYGPTLPMKDNSNLKTTEDDEVYGPTLLQKNETTPKTKIYGPSLLNSQVNNVMNQDPPSDDDDDVIGPLPPSDSSVTTAAQTQLEIRALQLKMNDSQNTDDGKQVREDWMLSLPDVKLFTGVGPRQFRPTTGPDFSDRSAWTDTPEDKIKRKAGETKEINMVAAAEDAEMRRRDKEQEKIAKKEKKKSKRDRSLLDLHQEKLLKKKKEIGGPTERRPFDRDIDLKISRVDPTKKASMIKGASLLDSKFSTGKTKFL